MKKKIFAIALAVMLFALAIAGSSVAYFTDVEKATNTFTAGDVDIKLTYAGTNVADEDDSKVLNTPIEIGDVYPSQVITVGATITNVGSEEAYVGAIITLSGMGDLIVGGNTATGKAVLFQNFIYDLTASNDAIVKYVFDEANDTITVYVVEKTKLTTTGDDTSECVIFDKVEIPASWDHEEMETFVGITLEVKAYATQVRGFEATDAEGAIIAAFGATDWAGYASATVLN